MCFEHLYDAYKNEELLLIDGGMCHWHLRRDGQLTIREIISTKPGSGKQMLGYLKSVPRAKFILAKCPSDLSSNVWYQKNGFICNEQEITKSGRRLNIWKLHL